MSVQSTSYITREQAEKKCLDKIIDTAKITLLAQISALTNHDIENYIEGQFDNYIIN